MAPGISKAYLGVTLLGLIIAAMQKGCAFVLVFFSVLGRLLLKDKVDNVINVRAYYRICTRP